MSTQAYEAGWPARGRSRPTCARSPGGVPP